MDSNNNRQRPTVLITTYSDCPIRSGDQTGKLQQVANSETRSEHSTNLFSNKRSHLKSSPTSNSSSFNMNQIKGPSGSIRGHRDVVKKSLENIKVVALNSQRNFTSSNLLTFVSAMSTTSQRTRGTTKTTNTDTTNSNPVVQHIGDVYQLEYLKRLFEDEQDHCVAYTTTLGVIRNTFEASKLMRSILDLNLIRYEERDIYLNQEFKLQLKMRCKSIKVPALFVDGQHFGVSFSSISTEIYNENKTTFDV